MLTNFVSAASTGLCRGLNGVLGHFPAACLTNGGQPALYLTGVVLLVLVAGSIVGWNKLHG